MVITLKNTLTAQISIRKLLFRWLLVPLLGLIIAIAVAGYPLALYPATATYDWALMDTALSLSRLIALKHENHDKMLPTSIDIILRTDKFDRIYYSVRDASGTLTAGDADLPQPPLSSFVSGELMYDSVLNDQDIRVAALLLKTGESNIIVQFAETTVKRRRMVAHILTGMIISEIVLVMALIILVWFGVGKGLEPLQRLRNEIELRSYRDLRPVPENHVPVEVQPFVHALNSLLTQLGDAFHTQQRFVANAAHQLRTPLAGLRMQIESSLQQELTVEWRGILRSLQSTSERMAHLVNQLLTLAKAEIGTYQFGTTQSFDLSSVVEKVIGEWMPRAIGKKIDVGLSLVSASINGDSLLVGELLSNLVDNAISYTPAGGEITIRTKVDGEMSFLEVADNGTGIPIGERENVFGRFYRLNGSPGEGCGLGLAIVQEIAHLHAGQVEIQTPSAGIGTIVIVRFPAAKPTDNRVKKAA